MSDDLKTELETAKAEFFSTLKQLIKALDEAKATQWVDYFQDCLAMAESPRKALLKFSGAFGGMGSFNDIYWNETFTKPLTKLTSEKCTRLRRCLELNDE